MDFIKISGSRWNWKTCFKISKWYWGIIKQNQITQEVKWKFRWNFKNVRLKINFIRACETIELILKI